MSFLTRPRFSRRTNEEFLPPKKKNMMDLSPPKFKIERMKEFKGEIEDLKGIEAYIFNYFLDNGKYIIIETFYGSYMGINCKVPFTNRTRYNKHRVPVVSVRTCTFMEYISYKIPFIV